MRFYGSAYWMPPACPGEIHVPNYTRRCSTFVHFRLLGGFAAEETEMKLGCSPFLVVEIVTIPRTKPGAFMEYHPFFDYHWQLVSYFRPASLREHRVFR